MLSSSWIQSQWSLAPMELAYLHAGREKRVMSGTSRSVFVGSLCPSSRDLAESPLNVKGKAVKLDG